MRAVIPEYILPLNILDAEIEALSKLGVKIQTQSKVESVDTLLNKGYDAVFLAIGGTLEIPEQLGVKVNEENAIQVNTKSLMTNKKGVFAGGDAVTRNSSFIEAVAAGRKAAISIDRYLGGSGDISEVLAPVIEGVPRVGRIDNFAQRQRQEMPTAKPAKQIGDFTQVELGFSDELGNEEAKRCMGCDLRFAVARMVAGPAGKAAKTPVRT